MGYCVCRNAQKVTVSQLGNVRHVKPQSFRKSELSGGSCADFGLFISGSYPLNEGGMEHHLNFVIKKKDKVEQRETF